MPAAKNSILVKMLDRLFAGLSSGPNLNCRPHSSRQRIDWTQFARLHDIAPNEALKQLLSGKQASQFQAQVDPPKRIEKPAESTKGRSGSKTKANKKSPPEDGPVENESLSPEEQKHCENWSAQQALLTKLRGLAEDAREYEQDTGVHVLHVGFPLLSLPPGVSGAFSSGTGGSKRLLAPIAFVSVSLEVRAGLHPIIAINGLNDGADFLVPNEALFAWLERQTGQKILPEMSPANVAPTSNEPLSEDLQTLTEDSSDTGPEPSSQDGLNSIPAAADSWVELNELVARVAKALHLPKLVITDQAFPELQTAPRTDNENPRAEIVFAAVLGLFPMNKQGLLRDMQAMVDEPSLTGPVQNFLNIESELSSPIEDRLRTEFPVREQVRVHPNTERLISAADPFQARAVRLARESAGLVVHGPPGTGKSQTITNMIGDHLVRGERVLLVCDKRTALDVVANRLESLGLGSLFSLIHDPQHDQRNLYKKVREQLESLTAAKVNERAQAQLDRLDQKLKTSLDQLSDAWSLVMERDPERGVSFHERMGEWLESSIPTMTINSQSGTSEIAPSEESSSDSKASSGRGKRRRRDKNSASTASAVEPVTFAQFQEHESDLRDVVGRAAKIGFSEHPWQRAVGISLTKFLERPQSQIRDEMAAIVECAQAVDDTLGASASLLIAEGWAAEPPTGTDLPDGFSDSICSGPRTASSTSSFLEQASILRQFADRLERCFDEIDAATRAGWSKAPKSSIDRAASRLLDGTSAVATARAEPLDAQLLSLFRAVNPTVDQIASQVVDLDDYLSSATKWYAWIAFRENAKASEILRKFGLSRNPANAERVQKFLSIVLARNTMAEIMIEVTPAKNASAITFNDQSLVTEWDQRELLVGVLVDAEKQPNSAKLKTDIRQSLATGDKACVSKLKASVAFAEALDELRSELVASELFQANWLSGLFERACRGESIVAELRPLESSVDRLVDVLRIRQILEKLPASLRRLTEKAATESESADMAMNLIQFQVLSDDISEWLKSNPGLRSLDGTRLNELNREVRGLLRDKQALVRDLILNLWIGRQRQRLLAGTGTRLNSVGADLRRRLTTRGERAMRLRQVISVGSRLEGIDPLFDLCPVWMASPETVAQIFPREAMFDVVIFDEASQCRLEEALPVLTRAKRVVIAGDPKQLPPSRFFESAVVTSDNAVVETEQGLFEAHQSEIEDLLTAALSLNVQECYLDVHYRSRNADLVEFSNEQFYGSRLQVIPGHPKNRIRFAPITLYQVGGIFDERCNSAEADCVCRIVADLLRRSEPPSIGIACFNMTQRDLILEKLDEQAAADEDFAGRLATARRRSGEATFEGLFVKNLENVQGDERDHMIISTTYGVDKQGRFYRRFGPLGQAGGGRRLNVLVTRAREEVHLVTSIPADLYRSLPPIPQGQQPGGAWLLFAYLAYAEQLAADYSRWRESDDVNGVKMPSVIERPTKTPSAFARAIAQLAVARHGVGSDLFRGNDGFCVDVAFHHPTRPDDRTLGLVCDGTRFQQTDDPVEWDLFRTAVLEGQGWELQRCWTPEFFRDPNGHLQNFLSQAARIAESDPDPEGIPVQ